MSTKVQAIPKHKAGEPMKVTLPYPPSLNHLYVTINGFRALSKRGKAFKAQSAALAFHAGLRPVSGDVIVAIDIYRPKKIGDLDNTFKIIMDALKGLAWNDDRQVVEIHARRYDDKKNPRAEVTIKEVLHTIDNIRENE